MIQLAHPTITLISSNSNSNSNTNSNIFKDLVTTTKVERQVQTNRFINYPLELSSSSQGLMDLLRILLCLSRSRDRLRSSSCLLCLLSDLELKSGGEMSRSDGLRSSLRRFELLYWSTRAWNSSSSDCLIFLESLSASNLASMSFLLGSSTDSRSYCERRSAVFSST